MIFCFIILFDKYVHIKPPNIATLSVEVTYNYRTSTIRLSAITATRGLTYQWSASSFNLATSRALLSTSTTLPVLSLSYDALPGDSYTFTVVGMTSTGQSASASANVVIPQAPTGGSCVCTPPRGNALTTSFTLACPDWQFADSVAETSLRYAFSYILDGVEVSLGSARYSSSIKTHLPAPPSGSQLQLVARIIGAAPFSMSTISNFSVDVDLPVSFS